MPSRDIKDCVPLLQEFWPKVKGWYEGKFPGRTIFLTCTFRTVKEQQEIFAQNRPGRVFTRCDGIKNKSNHNLIPSQAIDVAVSIKGRVVWEDEFYTPLGGAVKDLNYTDRIRWGGWFSFHDFPHFETI